MANEHLYIGATTPTPSRQILNRCIERPVAELPILIVLGHGKRPTLIDSAHQLEVIAEVLRQRDDWDIGAVPASCGRKKFESLVMTMRFAVGQRVIPPPRKIDDCDIQTTRVLDALLGLGERARTNDRLTLRG